MGKEILTDTCAALHRNGIEAEAVSSRGTLLLRLAELLPSECVIASGSSETLTELGIREYLHAKKYEYYDAGNHTQAPLEREETIRKAFYADIYLTSVSAVTQTGELMIVDGTGNRAAALSYGPKKVIIIAGSNKLVPDERAAWERISSISAPQNAKRRGKFDLPCAKYNMCMNCKNSQRMCCCFLRIAYNRVPGRFHVLLLNERVGF